MVKSASALALLGAISGADAFWRMQCKGRTGTALIDPIVDFDKVADHAHVFHGSSGISENAEYSDLRAANCTSCAVKQDMSAYWTPALYFKDASTNKFEPVPQVGGLLAYYLLRNGDTQQKITAFPPGFRMLAGSTYRRDYTLGDPHSPDPPTSDWAALGQVDQASLAQRALGFNCMDYSIAPEGSLYRHYLPDKAFTDAKCKDGVRFELMFPSCWNGELDSDDHKSHMAYPSLVGDGTCPEGYSKRLVTLFFETIWATNAAQFQGRQGEWVIANGDPTGFGYHGDFMNGWDENFLQTAVDRCTNESGVLQDCPQFMENGPLLTEPEQESCLLPDTFKTFSAAAVPDGALAGLPGGVQIQAGPESATPKGKGNIIASLIAPFVPSIAPVPITDAPSVNTNLPAQVSTSIDSNVGAFSQSTTSSTLSTSTSTPSPSTPAPVVTPPPVAPVVAAEEDDSNAKPVRTEFITKGDLVQEIVYYEAIEYVTEDVVVTTTVNVVPMKYANRKHRRSHGRHHH